MICYMLTYLSYFGSLLTYLSYFGSLPKIYML